MPTNLRVMSGLVALVCGKRELESEREEGLFYSLTIKYFIVNQILHLNKHGKMCKIISEKYFTSKQSIKRMLYEVINNLDGFKSRLVEALQLLLNLQFLFLTKDGVSVSNSSCCHWYEKAQAQGHLYCP